MLAIIIILVLIVVFYMYFMRETIVSGIMLERQGSLNIDEVEVWTKEGVNVALNSTGTSTSYYSPKQQISQMVDGIKTGKYAVGGVGGIFATVDGNEAQKIVLTFPLPTPLKNIAKVTVYNRTECCQERINGLVLTLLEGTTVVKTVPMVVNGSPPDISFDIV